jgi:hypothetical protein
MGDKLSFAFQLQAVKAKQQNARVNQTLPENKISKVFVRCYQHCVGFPALRKHSFIIDARRPFN